MASQVEIVANKNHVLEGGSLPLTIYFRDRETAAADVPANVSYRVQCLATKQEITPWTTLSASASVALTLSGLNTDIRDACNYYEKKSLQVKADSGASDEVRGQFVYTVENLWGTE